MQKVQTLKGFRDFLPVQARKRQFVVDRLKAVFESYDFQPLETPSLEYEEILTGKYGDEGEKLMYRFEDHGKRRVAMRYDQTVPLARVVAQYQHELPMPFMRYQIQNVWRAENTQKGRFREFLQCDADIVGTSAPIADARLMITAAAGLYELGFKKFTVLINDRTIFAGLSTKAIIILDKLKKIGEDGIIEELVANNLAKDQEEARNILQSIRNAPQTERLQKVFQTLEILKEGILEGITFEYSPTLARGLDYYTSTIFEIEIEGYTVGSVCGGGRYDELIGMFAGKQIPSVGFAYGFDRVLEALDELNIPLHIPPITEVLVTIFSEGLQNKSLEIANLLRNNEIRAEVYLGERATKLDKQLKYADQKGIPFAIIIGPDEAKNDTVVLKNLKTRKQETIALEKLIEIIHSSYKL